MQKLSTAVQNTTRRDSRSAIIGVLVYSICPVAITWGYRAFITPHLGVVDALVLIGVGIFLASFLNSFLRAPRQFFEAVVERLVWAVAVFWAIILNVLAILISVAGRLIRVVVAIVISAVYGVFPIDLLPDLILGVGWMDDGLLFLGTMYWALFAGTKVVKYSLRENARNVVRNAAITTPFP